MAVPPFAAQQTMFFNELLKVNRRVSMLGVGVILGLAQTVANPDFTHHAPCRGF
jgi:hypothetical protein